MTSMVVKNTINSVQDFCDHSIQVSDSKEEVSTKLDPNKKMFLHIFIQAHMEEVGEERVSKNIKTGHLKAKFYDKAQEKDRFVALTTNGLRSIQRISQKYNQVIIVTNGLWDLNRQLKNLSENQAIPRCDQVELFSHGAGNMIRLGYSDTSTRRVNHGYAKGNWAQTLYFPTKRQEIKAIAQNDKGIKGARALKFRNYTLGNLDKVMKRNGVLNLRTCWSGRNGQVAQDDPIAKKISTKLNGRVVVGIAGKHSRDTVMSRTIKSKGFYTLEGISNNAAKKQKRFETKPVAFLNGRQISDKNYKRFVAKNEQTNTE